MPDIELPNHPPIVPYPAESLHQTRFTGLNGLPERTAAPLNGPLIGPRPDRPAPQRAEDTQQSRTWSSTIPVACISA